MKIPEVKKSEMETGKMYLWKMSGGEIRAVWLDDNDSEILNEWEDGGWELELLAGNFFGPVDISSVERSKVF